MQVKVTYAYRGKAYTIQPLFYHSETVVVSGGGEIEKLQVLDTDQHLWPEGRNNIEDVISEMVNLLQTSSDKDKEEFKALLEKLGRNIKKAWADGMPARFWPNPLNNNHWHDVYRFIQRCLSSPKEIEHLCTIPLLERINNSSITRLIYEWQRGQTGKRLAFHAQYDMVKKLVETAMKYSYPMRTEEQIKSFSHLLKRRKQIILMGPPGVSKTYLARRIAAHLLDIVPEEVGKEGRARPGERLREGSLSRG